MTTTSKSISFTGEGIVKEIKDDYLIEGSEASKSPSVFINNQISDFVGKNVRITVSVSIEQI